MTDELTDGEKAKITDWFQRVPDGLRCPVCKSGGWTIYSDLVAPLTIGEDRSSVKLGGRIYPHFVMCCQTCGNTLQINAYVAGVLDRPVPAGVPSDSADRPKEEPGK